MCVRVCQRERKRERDSGNGRERSGGRVGEGWGGGVGSGGLKKEKQSNSHYVKCYHENRSLR